MYSCMLNTDKCIHLCLYLCSISIAMLLTIGFIPHLVERQFATIAFRHFHFQNRHQRNCLLWMLPFTVKDYKAIHVPLQSDRIKFSKFSTSKIGQEEQTGIWVTQIRIATFLCKGENCSLKSKAFLQEVPDIRRGTPCENSPETRVILVEK